jgi:CHAT domain
MSAVTNYLDLDLLIEKDDDGYRARVIGSPGGQASSQFMPPFSQLELENFLLKVGMSLTDIRRNTRRIDSSDMAEIKSFGGRLFRALFDEQLQPTLVRSLDEARRRQAGLRLRLRLSDAPELADFPWEYLYDTGANRFLNLSVETPLVRYLELPEPGRPLTVQPPLKILVMISAPSDVAQLDVDVEWNRITSAVADLEARGLVTVERLETATMAALQQTLRRGEYHILHYVGHGGYDEHSQDGVLLLEGMDGRRRAVSGQDLGTLLHDHRSLRLVILNSCEGARSSPTDPFAGAAQSLVQQGIPAVIAMQFEITDDAAITLSHEFYSALADGYAVDTALGEARKAIFAGGNEVEWGTPVLYMRSTSGRLFKMQPPTPRTTPERAEPDELPAVIASLSEDVAATRDFVAPQQAVAMPPDPVLVPDPIAESLPIERIEQPSEAVVPEPTTVEAQASAIREATDEQVKKAMTGSPGEEAPAEPGRGSPSMLATQLSLIGAAVLLVGLGLSNSEGSQGTGWFALEPLLAVAGAAAIGVLAAQRRQPAWGGGALIGLGFYLVATYFFLISTPDHGFQAGLAVITIGGALILGAGVSLWRRSAVSDPIGVGWLPATGGLVVAAAAFLPVTSDSGPVFLTELGNWLVGDTQAFLVPLLLVAGWTFVLSLYPSKRVMDQRGQILTLGLQLVAFFLSAAVSSVNEGWGTGYGLWLAWAGAALIVAGVVRLLRKNVV